MAKFEDSDPRKLVRTILRAPHTQAVMLRLFPSLTVADLDAAAKSLGDLRGAPRKPPLDPTDAAAILQRRREANRRHVQAYRERKKRGQNPTSA